MHTVAIKRGIKIDLRLYLAITRSKPYDELVQEYQTRQLANRVYKKNVSVPTHSMNPQILSIPSDMNVGLILL